MDADGGIQTGGGLPGPVTHPGNEFAIILRSAAAERNGHCRSGRERSGAMPATLTWTRSTEESTYSARPAHRALFAHATCQGSRAWRSSAIDPLAAKSPYRGSGIRNAARTTTLERESRLLHFLHDVAKSCSTKWGSMKLSRAVRFPSGRAAEDRRALPEAGDESAQELLRATCGHGAAFRKARSSSRPWRPAGPSGSRACRRRIPERCVFPVTSTADCARCDRRPRRNDRPVRVFARKATLQFVRESFQLHPPRRLAGRADEESRKQVGEAGMVVPVGDQASADPAGAGRRIIGGRAAQDEVIAASGPGVPPVEHEFFCGEARETR